MSNFNDAEKVLISSAFNVYKNFDNATLELKKVSYSKDYIHGIVSINGHVSSGNIKKDSNLGNAFQKMIDPYLKNEEEFLKIDSFTINPINHNIYKDMIVFVSKNDKYILDLELVNDSSEVKNHFSITPANEIGGAIRFKHLTDIDNINKENLTIAPLFLKYLDFYSERLDFFKKVFSDAGMEDWFESELLKYNVEGI